MFSLSHTGPAGGLGVMNEDPALLPGLQNETRTQEPRSRNGPWMPPGPTPHAHLGRLRDGPTGPTALLWGSCLGAYVPWEMGPGSLSF